MSAQQQSQKLNIEFPYTLTLALPFPTPHLSTTALRALSVDAELSPLVHRRLSIPDNAPCDLVVEYAATTNRMLRVAVNGFLESVRVVVGVMRELDVDVYERERGSDDLKGVQGLQAVSGVEG